MTEAVKLSQALKPCPFCGCGPSDDPDAEQVQVYTLPGGTGHVYCEKCSCEGPYEATRALAAAAWNTRHESQLPLLEALERTAAALDSLRRNIGAASLSRNPLGKTVRAEAEAAIEAANRTLTQIRREGA